jgi:hypothetical protein
MKKPVKKLLSLFLLVPCLAFGQTRTVVISSDMDSIWSVQTWVSIQLTGSASILDASDNVISTAGAGTIGVVSSISTTFPAMTKAVSVAKIKLVLTQSGGNWTGTWIPTYTFPTPLALNIGDIPTFVYNPTASLLRASLTANITNAATPVPVLTWTQIAYEHGSFTLTATTTVRYGINTSWIQKTLNAGTYVCDNALFTDPAVGSPKVCQVMK